MDEQKPNVDPVKPEEPNYIAPTPGTTYPTYTPPSVPTNSLAIVSLVSSVISWVFLPFVGGIIGLVTGIMARKEIKQSNGAQGGDGMATVGIIVSAINMVFMCLVAVCVSAVIMGAIASEARW
ncbi:MAG: DUF4190 domain-containing protein [Anaerolineae bacterium]|nr:DUF4190 domain-containing protein [Anaerolineae bacterium]